MLPLGTLAGLVGIAYNRAILGALAVTEQLPQCTDWMMPVWTMVMMASTLPPTGGRYSGLKMPSFFIGPSSRCLTRLR
jgi:hypothetical protein